MLILRLEHHNFHNGDNFAGPYQSYPFSEVEHECVCLHDQDRWWDCSCYFDCTDHVHTFVERFAWEFGNGRHQPSPQVERLRFTEEWLFGFVSPSQFLNWFGAYAAEFARYGFVVGVYEIDRKHVRSSHRQAVFNPSYADLIEAFDPTDFKSLVKFFIKYS